MNDTVVHLNKIDNCKNVLCNSLTICRKCNLCGRFNTDRDDHIDAQQVKQEFGEMGKTCVDCAYGKDEPCNYCTDKGSKWTPIILSDCPNCTRLTNELKKWIAIGDNYEARELDAKDENAELRAMLKRLEWCDVDHDRIEYLNERMCPMCGNHEIDRHAESCELARLIKNTCSLSND